MLKADTPSGVIMSKLTATAIKSAKAKDKDYKLTDGQGLYLLVTKRGAKYWRLKYRIGGKERTLSLGVYPAVSLQQARSGRDTAKHQLARGIDPSQMKRVERLKQGYDVANTFEEVGREWFAVKMEAAGKSQTHLTRTKRLMEVELFSYLSARPINQITPVELLACLRKTEGRGAINSAHRAKQVAGQIFRYGIATSRCERDVSADLKGALTPVPAPQHFAALTKPDDVGRLLYDVDRYGGSPVTIAAIRVSAYTFQRPGAIRSMRWDDIDFKQKLWEFNLLKGRKEGQAPKPHIVPLSTQVIELLRSLEPITRRSPFVFPSPRGASRCMSENAVRTALRTMGYEKGTQDAHGFRATATTLLMQVLNERKELIELQIGHDVPDPNGRAYNRADFLIERTAMMQRWADYLDSIKSAARVED